MKNIFLLFLLILGFSFSFAQNDSRKAKKIDKRISKIDWQKSDFIKTLKVELDSTNAVFSIYKNKIEVKALFPKSNKELSIIYFTTNNFFDKVTVRENSSMPEDFWRTNVFYLENEKIFKEEERFSASGRMHGIVWKLMDEAKKTYSKDLNSNFLKVYILELFRKM